MRKLAIAGALLGCLLCGPAMAGDWIAVKLRGKVLVLVEGEWQPLHRGDAISDNRMIRTLGNGRVTFGKGDQVIDFGTNTVAQIVDFANGEKTTVWEHAGEIAIEANVETTEHFSVQTRFLAAVVKGTRFQVTTDEQGSTVEVTRGEVKVVDTTRDTTVFVAAGQQATVSVAAGQQATVVVTDHDLTGPSPDYDDGYTDNRKEPGDQDDQSNIVHPPTITPSSGDGAGDNNNGHGNDADHLDEGNPGRGNNNPGKGNGKPNAT